MSDNHRSSADSLAELLEDGFRYAMSLTHEVAAAEDILQDAWLSVLKARGPHEKPYLFSAIRTRFINQYRRELLVPISSVEDQEFAGADPSQQQTSNMCMDIAGSEDMNRRLDGLRPVEREALYLSAVEGYTAAEIALKTEQPRSSVLSLIRRAKMKIRTSFDKEFREVQS